MNQTSGLVEQIAKAIGRFRLPRSEEATYQLAVEDVLGRLAIEFEAQRDLGAGYGRIDLFVPAIALGVELKVKGSLSEVTAQLHRYATCPLIERLMLVTGSVRLGQIPSSMNGKPVTVVPTWRGYL